jgi:hypothetical protein
MSNNIHLLAGSRCSPQINLGSRQILVAVGGGTGVDALPPTTVNVKDFPKMPDPELSRLQPLHACYNMNRIELLAATPKLVILRASLLTRPRSRLHADTPNPRWPCVLHVPRTLFKRAVNAFLNIKADYYQREGEYGGGARLTFTNLTCLGDDAIREFDGEQEIEVDVFYASNFIIEMEPGFRPAPPFSLDVWTSVGMR